MNGKYTWKDWWYDHSHAVLMVGVMVVGIVAIEFMNGWS